MKEMSVLRFIAAFLVGTVMYVVGFVVGGLLMELANGFVLFLPPSIDLDGTSIVASAIAANAAGYYVFALIGKRKMQEIVFAIWMIVIATVYATLCFITADTHLLIYPVVCYVIDGIIIYSAIREMKGGKQNEDPKS